MFRNKSLKALMLTVSHVLVVVSLAGCGPSKATAVPPIATPIPQTRVINGLEMVFVPAEKFRMGSTDEQVDLALQSLLRWLDNAKRSWFADEQPVHTVVLDAFWIGKYEVTNEDYWKFIDAGGYRDSRWWSEEGWKWVQATNRRQPSGWSGYPPYAGVNYPVVGVSWYEADAFARWAGGRLPTEAEWEKAARGTDLRQYPWGNEFDGRLANLCDKNCESDWKDAKWRDGHAGASPVGSYPGGASPYGALDMAGNVWEWCADWYGEGYYQESPDRNPMGPISGTRVLDVFPEGRVLRGGSFGRPAPYARCAARSSAPPDNSYEYIGFRVVVSPVGSDF